MSYQALYRQWRPKNFIDLVGQEHIVTTLKNSIKQDRISHAYLFSGPRGTGKTSVAKVLAKALNCNYRVGEEPCGECSNCLEHDQGSFMELMEIDAASNRGIDEIREIRDHVAYTPSEGKYKIYIIDEVHMLTTEAFNAMLKTLEEPPAYVIFILATTEPHKLPMTVLSRCQRFDFYRLPEQKIIRQLQQVSDSKGVSVSPESLAVIAKKSEGGMRDALSLLDQCLSYLGDEQQLVLEHVLEITGTVSEEVFHNLLASLKEGNLQNVLGIIQNMSDSGKDFGQFLNDMITYVRDLLLYEMSGRYEQLLWGTSKTLDQLQGKFTKEQLLAMIDFLSEKQSTMKWSQNRRLIVEMVCYRLISNYGNVNSNQDHASLNVENTDSVRTTEQSSKMPAGMQEKEQTQSQAKPQNSMAANTRTQVEGSAEPGADSGNLNAIESGEKDAGASVSDSGTDLDLTYVQKNWGTVLEKLRQKKVSAHALVVEGIPTNVKENTIYLEFEKLYKLHKERVEQKEKGLLEEVVKEVFGEVNVKCVLANDSTNTNENKKTTAAGSGSKDEGAVDNSVEDLTGKAKQEFGPDKVEIYKQS